MYHDLHFRAMNTAVNAWLWQADAGTAQRALREAERFFHEAHSRFTRFETSSELSALNASAGRPFTASPQMFEVVELAVKYAALTNGWFNPTIIGALEAAGYNRTFDAIQETRDQRLTVTSPVSAASAIGLNAKQRAITLPKGVRIDLGGIAKGWAVQKTAQQLAIYGPCLVDAGGDMMTFGAVPDSSSWAIEIADPLDPDNDMMTLHVRDQAVATSGIDRRRWQRNGVWQHHLIDPHSGRPSESDLLTATVIAPTTVEAEVYAKTVFLLGAQAGLDFIDHRPMLAGSVITADGAALLSDSMKEHQHVRFSFSSTTQA
jgi:thiamine biosynthesis lipoprotein